MTCVGTGIGEAMYMKRCADSKGWLYVIQKEAHIRMTVRNHSTVNVTIGTPKAPKYVIRRIPRRRFPPITAHVLMVKTTVTHRSAPERRQHILDVDLLSAKPKQSSNMARGLTIKMEVFGKGKVDTYQEFFRVQASHPGYRVRPLHCPG